jgi:diaminohydroxyphosphoribosylaminopyrimidine deaminase / 5-amino-6-(5-phosphoribosylamino)uracil reductase
VARAGGLDVEVGVLADEAKLVLGPWLTALRTGRPQVTWAYQIGATGPSPTPDELVDQSALRHGFDAVLLNDSSLEEGIPHTHGPEAFALPAADLDHGTEAFLSALYAAGTRTLLLHGGTSVAQPYLEVGRIDRVRAFVTSSASSRPSLGLAPDWTLLPSGFEIEHVDKIDDAVAIEAVRGANPHG